MLNDITLGQFFPGDSFLHRRDPRFKIIASILYIVIVFLCVKLWSFGFLVAVTVLLILISGVPLKVILKSLKPLLFILIFTTLYNLFVHKGESLLLDLKFVKVYWEGVIYAVVMSVRIICLLAGSSVILTYTTSPIMLTDGLERLLSPLKYLHIPVHEFSMMMTIALRFIPTLIEETNKIINAQKARGADFNNGGLIRRAKALIPVLIPLVISAFRRATELAMAMECRCYRGGSGRTRMTQLKIHTGDFVFLTLIVAVGAAIVLINRFVPGFSV